MTAPTGIREAALYQYTFLTTDLESPTGDILHPEQGDLIAMLRQAVHCVHNWLGRPVDAAQLLTSLPLLNERRQELPVYPADGCSEWLHTENERWAGYLFARVKNNSLILQLAYNRRGLADEETWPHLQTGLFCAPVEEQFSLGQTLCFAGRVADLDVATAEAARLLPGDPYPLRRADLPLADGRRAWLFDRVGLPDRLALFYPDDDAAERLVAPYLNTVLPDLLLFLHKIAHQYGRGYEATLRLLLAEQERALARVLAQDLPPAGDVDGLDARLTALADAYTAFARELAGFDRLAQAVRVNLLNLREGFAEHGLPQEGPLAAWLTAAERAAAQLEADEGFYRARVRQAEMALAALQVRAEVERARLEQEEDRRDRRRNLLLGFIAAVLALGQVLSDAAVAEVLGWALGVAPTALPAWGVLLAKLGLVAGVGGLVVGVLAAVERWRRQRRAVVRS